MKMGDSPSGVDMKRNPAAATNLSPERRNQLDKRFVAYALAAAGVAVCTKPAVAEIVFTKTNKTIFTGSLPIDLNNDGVADFTLTNRTVAYSSSTYLQNLGVRGGSGAAVIGRQNGNSLSAWDAPLSWSIGPNSPKGFVNVGHHSARMAAAGGRCCFTPIGPWKSATNKYLGLQFTVKGQVHYGWARLTVSTVGDVVKTTLTGYAYESTPNTAILAGDRGPSASTAETKQVGPTLALLSLGAPGLNIWRKENS
jgi:hypothetical protein